MPVKDGPSCPHCGLPNYEGLCPHCRGDQDAYEHELVPPFETTRPEPEAGGGELDAAGERRGSGGAGPLGKPRIGREVVKRGEELR